MDEPLSISFEYGSATIITVFPLALGLPDTFTQEFFFTNQISSFLPTQDDKGVVDCELVRHRIQIAQLVNRMEHITLLGRISRIDNEQRNASQGIDISITLVDETGECKMFFCDQLALQMKLARLNQLVVFEGVLTTLKKSANGKETTLVAFCFKKNMGAVHFFNTLPALLQFNTTIFTLDESHLHMHLVMYYIKIYFYSIFFEFFFNRHIDN